MDERVKGLRFADAGVILTFIDSEEKLQRLLHRLGHVPRLAVDLEGVNLGHTG